MPEHALVFGCVADALDTKVGPPLNRASVFLIGISYRNDVSNICESPALKLIELLAGRVADVAFHDPLCSNIPRTCKHPALAGRRFIHLIQDTVAAYDAKSS